MKPENHTLIVTTRTDGSSRKNARCSCELWQMRNQEIRDIREGHRAHVQQMLGPDRDHIDEATA